MRAALEPKPRAPAGRGARPLRGRPGAQGAAPRPDTLPDAERRGGSAARQRLPGFGERVRRRWLGGGLATAARRGTSHERGSRPLQGGCERPLCPGPGLRLRRRCRRGAAAERGGGVVPREVGPPGFGAGGRPLVHPAGAPRQAGRVPRGRRGRGRPAHRLRLQSPRRSSVRDRDRRSGTRRGKGYRRGTGPSVGLGRDRRTSSHQRGGPAGSGTGARSDLPSMRRGTHGI